ncbi:trypsin alpha-4-like [Lucilia sericata]|uniref:trypsin alpha-4-like n=1 Tax=Lucilia sericata TaxID=13632 RepID=UPI0018A87D46|nr:trypsin alpha-4-like [Lucilia sericata]
MFKFIILLSGITGALSATLPKGLQSQLDGRIVGGIPTTISSVPWQISLQRSGSHSCGGAVLNPNIIITAAHCLRYASATNLKVRAGSTYWNMGGDVLAVDDFQIHEDYNSATLINDIGVVKLASSLTISSTIKPIALATQAAVDGAAAAVSGWGTTYYGSPSLPYELRSVDVEIVSRYSCASTAYNYGSYIQASMICAYTVGKDSCQGDSGGPLVSGGVLVGVVSWGNGCAFTDYPGVYADVFELSSWVVNTAASI